MFCDSNEESDSLDASGAGMRCRAAQSRQPDRAEEQQRTCHLHSGGKAAPCHLPGGALAGERKCTFEQARLTERHGVDLQPLACSSNYYIRPLSVSTCHHDLTRPVSSHFFAMQITTQ